MRVTKVHRNACVVTQLLVQRHLTALVVGHAVAHGLCNAEQLICKALEHVGRASRLGLRQLDQHHQAAGTLNQGAHSAGVGGTLDQVALPVAREQAVLYVGWAQVNAEHVWDLPTPVLPFTSGHTFVTRMAQGLYQVLLELPDGLGINAVVDGLG